MVFGESNERDELWVLGNRQGFWLSMEMKSGADRDMDGAAMVHLLQLPKAEDLY